MDGIKRALADYCRDAGRSPAKALAELAAELMLSDDSDPLHEFQHIANVSCSMRSIIQKKKNGNIYC